MTVKERAKFFDEASDQGIDLSAFKPKPATQAPLPTREEVRAVSEAANFPSREAPKLPAKSAKKRDDRIHRTGRNVQFQAKATQSTIDRFYALCDQHDWRLGEALERAVDALEREIKTKR